jgi:putative ABC transport system ATP-binding protein
MNDILLEFKNATKTFLQGDEIIHALKPTNFLIKAGEFVIIIGPSGSGKSTFLTIAGGLQPPSSGQIIIDDQNITDMNLKQLSHIRLKYIGFILQSSNLVPFLTIDKQLELYNRVTRTKIDEKFRLSLFQNLGIEKMRKKYPNNLSGGERQRAAIAKALYSRPEIILADEPTASLDTNKALEVVKILAKETHERKKATIMVTHDERLIPYCDKAYEMNDGMLSIYSRKI